MTQLAEMTQRVLGLIVQTPSISPYAIASKLGISLSTAKVEVNRLRAAGCILDKLQYVLAPDDAVEAALASAGVDPPKPLQLTRSEGNVLAAIKADPTAHRGEIAAATGYCMETVKASLAMLRRFGLVGAQQEYRLADESIIAAALAGASDPDDSAPTVTPSMATVLAILMQRPWYSNQEIADASGYAMQTVLCSLWSLKALGLISRRRHYVVTT